MTYPFDCITDFIFVQTSLEPADVIFVPGSNHVRPMEKATELYHKGLTPFIIPSGGFNPEITDYPSEWARMRQIGLSLGVPDEAILKEDKARNTFENARLSWDATQQKGITVKKAILVCKAYHSRRVLLTFQSELPAGIQFYVCSVDDESEITRDNWFLSERKISTVMREVVKIGSYFEEEIAVLRDAVKSRFDF